MTEGGQTAETPRARVMVAGLGNIFRGDDAFGVEVAKRLAEQSLPPWVRVADFGIRGLHLAYELLDGGYATTILVDAVSRGEAAGTVYLVEPEVGDGTWEAPPSPDAHGMTPDAVLAWLRSLGGTPGRVLVVGCEPHSLDETMGLSETVAGAVDQAVGLILELLDCEGSEEGIGGRGRS